MKNTERKIDTIGNLCNVSKGQIGIKKAIEGEYPLVVTSEERKSHNEYHFEGEAVIIPLVSSTGHGHKSLKRIHYQTGKFAVGSILCAVMPKDKKVLNAEYLYRYLDLNKETELVSRMKGMANVTLPIKEIKNIEIPLPPLAEQIKFVEDYKKLEKTNNTLSNELIYQLDLVKKLRSALLQEAISGELIKEWRQNNPPKETATELLEQIKAEKQKLIKEKKIRKPKPLPPITKDEIPFEIPKNWVWCRLGEVTTYGSSDKIEAKDILPNTWVLDLEDIEKETSKILCKITLKERPTTSTKSIFKKGWVLYSKLRPYLDKVVLADDNGVCTTEILPLPIYAEINGKFLMYSMKTESFLKYANSKVSGMKMPRLKTDDGKMAIIPLPPKEEQQIIVEKLDALMRYCDSLEESIKNSQKQNRMLLSQVLREALKG